MSFLSFSGPAQAQEYFPACAQKYIKSDVQKVGTSRFRKFGFTIYHATLWAPNGVYDANKPYALAITYNRDLDKGTLLDAITDDIKLQNAADAPTQAAWRDQLDGIITEVKENDTLIGVFVPGEKSALIRNCQVLGAIDDMALTKAFFSIWLGPTADSTMRSNLTKQ